MTDSYPNSSALWEHINKFYITENQFEDLTNFKSNIINYKISLWNPHTNGIRYLKTLIYNLCASLSEDSWQMIRSIKNREIGNPITINYNNEEICLDYIQAVYELGFINKNENIRLDRCRILEIGAGYGRTCHTILSNHDVEAYYVIDLENCLRLSEIYLKQVLEPERFVKIKFIPVTNFNVLQDVRFDLCINVDSFAEMDAEIVKLYLNYIDLHCNYFYVKNPVGKYKDSTLSLSQNDKEVELALNTGLLRDIIDINNNIAIKYQSEKFVDAYSPGNRWKCIDAAWSPPWSFYWQALYRNSGFREIRN
jgi:putative sugar O-methyltransferase